MMPTEKPRNKGGMYPAKPGLYSKISKVQPIRMSPTTDSLFRSASANTYFSAIKDKKKPAVIVA